MKQTKKTKKTESGRSMIEMVGVLAVMGLITVGAFVLITSAMKSQKLSRLDDDMSAMAAGVRLMFNSTNSFDNASDDTLKAIGFDKKNQFGGNYHLAGEGEQFFIYVDGLSTSDCGALITRTFPGGGQKVAGGKYANGKFQEGPCEKDANAVMVTYGRNSDQ